MSEGKMTGFLPHGVSAETWAERVDRRFRDLADTTPLDATWSEEQNRTMMIVDAQFRADKEMLNEIHQMLRFICVAVVSGCGAADSSRESNRQPTVSACGPERAASGIGAT